MADYVASIIKDNQIIMSNIEVFIVNSGVSEWSGYFLLDRTNQLSIDPLDLSFELSLRDGRSTTIWISGRKTSYNGDVPKQAYSFRALKKPS